jgi:MoaA/NifB/PqqE/SkfB family radical SAM enzyme
MRRMFFSFGRTVGWKRAFSLGSQKGRMGAVVQIENTSRCNFHCVYCPTHSPNALTGAAKATMDLATFRGILDANPRAKMVHLQGQGEPFLDPGIWEKLDLCRERRLFTEIISNGSVLHGKTAEKLLASPLNVLFVSVDVAAPEEVERHRLGMNYARVLENVRALTAERDKRGLPLVIGLISVFYSADAARLERALAEFDALGIDVMLYKELNGAFEERIGGYKTERLVDPAAKLKRRLGFWMSHQRGNKPVKPCLWLKNDFRYYLADGQATACCALNEARYAAPEWSRESLLTQWRQKALPSECEHCSYFGGYEEDK